MQFAHNGYYKGSSPLGLIRAGGFMREGVYECALHFNGAASMPAAGAH